MKKYLISSNIFKRKAQFALWTITGNFIIFIHRIACLKRNFTFAHVLQTCGAMFHWLSRKDYMSFELNGNTQSKCTRLLTDVYIFRNRNCETSHASTSVTAQSMGISLFQRGGSPGKFMVSVIRSWLRSVALSWCGSWLHHPAPPWFSPVWQTGWCSWLDNYVKGKYDNTLKTMCVLNFFGL